MKPPAAATSVMPAELFPVSAVIALDDGLSLAEANALALFYAPTLVTARGDLELKGAELLRAGLLSNPELFLGPRLATSGGALIFPASLSLRIPLDDRRGAEKARAASEIEAARLLLLSKEAEVLISVRQRFTRIAGLQASMRIRADLARASAEAFRGIEGLFRAGRADQVALGLASLDRDEAARDLRDAEAAVERSRIALLTFIGLLPDPALKIAADEALLVPVPVPDVQDHQRMLGHPHLRALEASYRAREFGLKSEVARQYPALSIGPDFESDDGDASIGVGLSISLPIFDSNSGAIAVAKVQRTIGRDAWRAALVDLASREALARMNLRSAAAHLEALTTRTLPAAAMAEKALAARLGIGQVTLVEALATRGAIARARLRRLELRQEVATRSLEALWYAGLLLAPPADTDPEEEGEKR